MLRSIAESVWVYDFPFSIAKVELGGRCTVLRLAGDGLLLHSPGPVTNAFKAEIATLGRVRFVLAPNLMHHLFVEENLAAFPGAQLLGAEGLSEKRPELKVEREWGNGSLAELDPSLESVTARGMPRVNEVVVLHKPSQTLLLTDLAFNLGRAQNWITHFVMRLNDAQGRFGPSRVARALIRERGALRASIEQILEWDFDRIVMAHGNIVESGGKQALRSGYAWLLRG